MASKADIIYGIYLGLDPAVAKNNFTRRLCDKIVEKLTDQEFEVLYNYMTSPEYASIYASTLEATNELMIEEVGGLFNEAGMSSEDYDDLVDETNKYGKN